MKTDENLLENKLNETERLFWERFRRTSDEICVTNAWRTGFAFAPSFENMCVTGWPSAECPGPRTQSRCYCTCSCSHGKTGGTAAWKGNTDTKHSKRPNQNRKRPSDFRRSNQSSDCSWGRIRVQMFILEHLKVSKCKAIAAIACEVFYKMLWL